MKNQSEEIDKRITKKPKKGVFNEETTGNYNLVGFFVNNGSSMDGMLE
jgi:hypothetical protein